MSDKFVYSCLIVMSFFVLALGPKDEAKYVRNLQEFRQHTMIHKRNVLLLGMSVFTKFRSRYFADVPEDILQDYLADHDQEKLASPDELKLLGYTGEKTFDERLYDFYTKNKDDITDPQEKKEWQDMNDEMAKFEGKYQYRFFKSHQLLDSRNNLKSIALKIVFIGKMADLVDRYKNKVSEEEFNKVMRAANEYFRESGARVMTKYLELSYDRIVPPNPLVERAEEQQDSSIMDCKALFSI